MWSQLVRRPLVLLVALVLLLLFTADKLVRMCQIKGWLPGATVQVEQVSALWRETRSGPIAPRHVYLIDWRDPRTGYQRLNLSRARWSALRVGSPIEIVHVPLDPLPYARDDIFVEPGNFAFDLLLLGLELFGIGFSIHLLRRGRVRLPSARPSL